jgi:hypothetical protein
MREHKQLASPLLNHAEVLPHELAPRLTLKRKSALGQFMTLEKLAARLPLTFRVLSGDFIAEAASQSLPLLALGSTRFTLRDPQSAL